MGRKFEKFWSGAVGFTAVEKFDDLNVAVKASVPSAAATISIDHKTLSYDFKRIKEVGKKDANALRGTGTKDPGERKGEKVSERKDNETKEKK